eukprot:CAMPEP_0172455502 /NCGR_PEP_ID=MMETSP1065-20121228/12098_1 /TAXON_ID=265537 /ORGANISM="Amphiprora paludosa, Strain CCMP125" /LENGTH=406 /DNA_ID=CAMNT_0013207963 /DNA_START=161 /DNA_END=1381 /DNA_ORIENTATION=+
MVPSLQNVPATTTTNSGGGATCSPPLNNLIKSVFMGQCYCGDNNNNNNNLSFHQDNVLQFVELPGMQFIGLGCMADELTPRERVYDTLEQLTSQRERLVRIGFLSTSGVTGETTHVQAMPLQVYNKQLESQPATTAKLSRPVQTLVQQIENQDYRAAKLQLSLQFTSQKQHLPRGNHLYLAGITAHNLAVVKMLCRDIDDDDESIIHLLEQAIYYKEQAFGSEKQQDQDDDDAITSGTTSGGGELLAYSWDELGIQYFCQSQFEKALEAFQQAQKVRHPNVVPSSDASVASTSPNPAGMAMVWNNMACCHFQLKDYELALTTLRQARILQQTYLVQTQGLADVDLLYNAIVMCNYSYLCLCLKRYEEARSVLEEALMIQQSCLEDENHRAIRDTRSNLEFTNAFHN